MTNKKDFKTFTENKGKIAEAIARAIIEGYKVEWKPKLPEEPKEPEEAVPEEKKLYKVQVGAFSEKENAEVMLGKLKAAGFGGFIV